MIHSILWYSSFWFSSLLCTVYNNPSVIDKLQYCIVLLCLKTFYIIFCQCEPEFSSSHSFRISYLPRPPRSRLLLSNTLRFQPTGADLVVRLTESCSPLRIHHTHLGASIDLLKQPGIGLLGQLRSRGVAEYEDGISALTRKTDCSRYHCWWVYKGLQCHSVSRRKSLVMGVVWNLTCKWLFTSSLVRPSTCISSLICFGVATAFDQKTSELEAVFTRKSTSFTVC